MDCILQEVLRMYPPVGIGQLREALTDVIIADRLKIPKGCLVWVPHLALQNAPHNWSNPDTFDPGHSRFDTPSHPLHAKLLLP